MRRLILPRTKSYNKLIDNFLVLSSFCEALLTSRGLLKALQKAICWVDRDFEISGKVEEGERQTWCEQEASRGSRTACCSISSEEEQNEDEVNKNIIKK